MLEDCPYLQAFEKPGSGTVINFKDNLYSTIQALDRNYDDAANIVRKDMFSDKAKRNVVRDAMV